MAAKVPAKTKNTPKAPLMSPSFEFGGSSGTPSGYYGTPSPYWPTTPQPSPYGQNEPYRKALAYFSATHRASIDSNFTAPSLLVHPPETPRYSIQNPSGSTYLPSGSQGPSAEPRSKTPPESDFANPLFPNYTENFSDARFSNPKFSEGPGISDIEREGHVSGEGRRLVPFEEHVQGIEDEAPLIGRTYRVLTRGNLHEADVDVSAHTHHGHIPAIKVRPAIGLPLWIPIPHEGRDGVPKVKQLCALPPFEYPDHILALSQSPETEIESLAHQDSAAAEVTLYKAQKGSRVEITEEVETESVVIYHHIGPLGVGSPFLKRTGSVDTIITTNTFGLPRMITGDDHHGHSEVSKVRQAEMGPGNIKIGIPSTSHPDYGSHASDLDTQPYAKGRMSCGQSKTVTWSSLAGQGGSVQGDKPNEVGGARSPSDLSAYWESMADNRKSQEQNNRDTFAGSPPGKSDRGSRVSRNCSRSSDSQLSGIKRTATWFRDFIRPSEPYKTKLTNFPVKKSTQKAVPNEARGPEQAGGSVRSRNPTNSSTNPTTPIDSKFKDTVKSLEYLLNEAMELAHEAVEREDQHHCADKFGAAEVEHHPVPDSLPSVHESLPSPYESSVDERAVAKIFSKPSLNTMHNSGVKRLPKHYRSAPGMHSRNVAVNIPARTSSLKKYQIDSAYETISGPHRDRFQEQRWSTTPPGHRSRPVSHSHEQTEEDSKPGVSSPIGCLPTAKIANKLKSYRSWNMSRVRHRPSLPRTGVDGASWNDDQPLTEDSTGIFENTTEGRIQKSSNWGFDGANDEVTDGPTEHLRGDTDGTLETDGPLSPPPTAQIELYELDQEGSVRHAPSIPRINLRGRSHVSIRGYQGFSLARAYKRQPVGRDWSTVRKRFVAAVACLSTAMIGVLIGIYAGMVPSIQYWIVDLWHYAILGNVFFYLGLAIPTFFFWSLPLLHGRKPYILSSLVIAMPLLFPQAISVSTMRSPYTSTWR
ncbi:hypothetical protein B0H66DRAFT_615974 [Apodospora peruviana]|uniref:Uncharacterized protein n=1 Tax=Apodospora peruviana TaxID=516989 RepID=A0AAE0II92_9PEZI|nr:hypothetical protein B0H66DRAFT_615974 [Apodospora peruviana]